MIIKNISLLIAISGTVSTYASNSSYGPMTYGQCKSKVEMTDVGQPRKDQLIKNCLLKNNADLTFVDVIESLKDIESKDIRLSTIQDFLMKENVLSLSQCDLITQFISDKKMAQKAHSICTESYFKVLDASKCQIIEENPTKIKKSLLSSSSIERLQEKCEDIKLQRQTYKQCLSSAHSHTTMPSDIKIIQCLVTFRNKISKDECQQGLKSLTFYTPNQLFIPEVIKNICSQAEEKEKLSKVDIFEKLKSIYGQQLNSDVNQTEEDLPPSINDLVKEVEGETQGQ